MFLTPTQINLSKFRIFLFKKRANLNNVGDLIWVPILDDKIMVTKMHTLIISVSYRL